MKLISIILLIRVLCIGNSFSWDAVEQELVPLCEAAGVEVEVHNLYFGGCSLEQHAQFLQADSAAYSHRICSNSPWTKGEWRIIKDTISLRRALQNGAYDFISFQQASHYSGIQNTYEPWLTMLVDTVRAYQPNAQLCWMQTWAYSQDSKHPAYPTYQSSQSIMWDSIQACTQKVLNAFPLAEDGRGLLLIPCGAAIQEARATDLGDTFCRDGYHLNYVYGRYTAACVWYEILTGRDVRCNYYKNPQMTTPQRCTIQKAVHKAVAPYKKSRQ